MIAEIEVPEDSVAEASANADDHEAISSLNQQQRQQPQSQPESAQQPVPQTQGTRQEDGDTESAYHLKWIPWNLGKIPIVMQSINGPCPLIATMNVLLLREKVKLPEMLEQITETQLLTYIGECIMDSIPPELQNDENALLNLEQNIHDAIEILPKLKTGLDVNIRFTGITDFEYTPECIIFDLLRIPLYHGWLCDPSLIELKNAIGTQSYNQLIDNIITNKTSQDPDKLTNVLIAEEFLDRTASQLTLHGLHELRTKIKDNEIGVLFRNNHFLTLFKRESVIYTLVTDHGYLTEDNVIWETLDNIEGAGRFFDSNFQSADTTNKQMSELKSIDQRQQQLENDFLMALSLSKNERHESSNVGPSTSNYDIEGHSSSANMEEDYELAKRLQDDFELAKQLQAEEYKSSSGGNSQAVVEWKEQDRPLSSSSSSRDTRGTQQIHHRSSSDHEWPRISYEKDFPPLAEGVTVVGEPRPASRQPIVNPTDGIGNLNEQSNINQQLGVEPAVSRVPSRSPEPSLISNVPQYDATGGGGGGGGGSSSGSGYHASRQHQISSPYQAEATTTTTPSRSQDNLPASNRLASSSSNVGHRSRGGGGEKNAKDSNCIIS